VSFSGSFKAMRGKKSCVATDSPCRDDVAMRGRVTIIPVCLSIGLGIGLMGSLGCSGGAQLVQDNESGGVVTYLYREDRGGPTGSRYRKNAIEIMKLRCPQGYIVVKEGETRGLSGVSSIEGAEEQGSRRWAFQFRCKT
jgi:hypothetical protein